MKNVWITIAAGFLLVPLVGAQGLDMKLDSLAASASKKAEVDLEGSTLEMALQMGGQKRAQAGKEEKPQALNDLLSSLKAVHVRHYEFAKAGDYSPKELEPLLKQVGPGSGWSRIISQKEPNQSHDIYLLSQGDKIGGCLIVSAEAKELNVVYLMGSMPIKQAEEMVNSSVKYDLASLMSGAGK